MISEIIAFLNYTSAFFRMCHQKCSIINKYKGCGQYFLKSLMVQEDIILITLHALNITIALIRTPSNFLESYLTMHCLKATILFI